MAELHYNYNPVVLILVDGLGIGMPNPGNAVTSARTPFLDRLLESGTALEVSVKGNVKGVLVDDDIAGKLNHMIIGAGRELPDPVARILSSIKSGSIFKNEKLTEAINYATEYESNLHLIAYLDESSESRQLIEGILAIVKHQKFSGNMVYIHLIVEDENAGFNLQKLMERMIEIRTGHLSTITTRKAFSQNAKLFLDSLIEAKGKKISDWRALFERKNENEVYKIINHEDPFPSIKRNDAVFMLNLQGENGTFLYSGLSQINAKIISLIEIGKEFPEDAVFPSFRIDNTLSSILSKDRKSQIKIADSNNLKLITYYFNGYKEEPLAGETITEIKVLKESTSYHELLFYKLEKSFEVLSEKIIEGKHQFFSVGIGEINDAAEAGDFNLTVKLIEELDRKLDALSETVTSSNGVLIITAEKGGAEALNKLSSESNVPLIVKGEHLPKPTTRTAKFSDIAPTVLNLMGIEKPTDMTGRNIFT